MLIKTIYYNIKKLIHQYKKSILKLVAMTTMNNTVQLIGHAGIDPEVKTFGNDRKVARLTLATNDYYYNNQGERVEETHWHRLVAWGKVAERVGESVKKGSKIAISGKLTTNTWEDKQGAKKQTVEVVITEILPM
jgi:single-strand DNA-binding protein